MIQYVTGDLFTYPGLDAIGHGCNCKGVMGSGIAAQFANKYPAMVSEYSALCANGMRPGAVHLWETGQAQGDRVIINMMTQDKPGRDARGLWIAQALDHAMKLCNARYLLKFGIPEIGSGIGGLPQDYCHYIFEETAERNPDIDLIVVRWEQDV